MECPLTPRELEIVKAMMDSTTYGEAAKKLGISRKTVDYHLLKVRKQLDINNTTRLLARCASEGWLK
jgi:DNA-binding CsgD family transcriptional regulator